MVELTKPLTIEEFVQQYDKAPFEIINGRFIPVHPPLFGHSKAIKHIYDAVLLYNQEHYYGEVFTETTFIIQYQTDWVAGSRIPDVLFVRKDRLKAYEEETEDVALKPLALIPDLVVEVVSKNDTYSEVNEKIDVYLDDGVELIWVVDTQRKRITVYEQGKQPITLGESDSVSGGAVIPGFELKLSVVFD
jgi:Uma2 family endonuclease